MVRRWGERLSPAARALLHDGDNRVVEVSRFAIPRGLPSMTPHGGATAASDQGSVSLGLIALALHKSLTLGISHWVAAMESALDRRLRRVGMCFQPAGPVLPYHGRRRAMIADVAALYAGVRAHHAPMAALLDHFAETKQQDPTPRWPVDTGREIGRETVVPGPFAAEVSGDADAWPPAFVSMGGDKRPTQIA
jgi:hypothetical protein